MNCKVCGETNNDDAKFCSRCGSSLDGSSQGFIVATMPTLPGYRVKRVIGIVSGITPRTRGIMGKFIAGIESMIGGEVTAFSYEIEKARVEAIDRLRSKAAAMGANAVLSVDIETSDMGYQMGILVFSATGTAVVVEPEAQS
ncbi:MAG: heavy metal-binding domain-containing protein [Candidatus Bathyarchaeota archaeon]|nr:heavy metal-binding domain-containing protein [Candidatus Bathyarchaeota archaeon]